MLGGRGKCEAELRGARSETVKASISSEMGDTELKKGLEQASAALLKVARIVHPGWDGKSKLKNSLKPAGVTAKNLFKIVEGVNTAFTKLILAVQQVQADKCPQIAELQSKVQDLESDLDSASQKMKTGTIILTQQKEVNLIKSEEVLEAENQCVEAHACSLIKLKTGVAVEESELKVAHHLPNGNLKVKFADLKPGSAFSQVVRKIKTKPTSAEKEVKLYLNFELTKRRNAVLYEIRRLKRENKLYRFFTDFDGTISVIQREGEKEKIKVTRNSGRSGGKDERRAGKQPARTLTPLEICRRFDPDFVEPEVEKTAATAAIAGEESDGSDGD